MIELFNPDTKVRVIGTRHGEKLYETLATREELAKSEDCGDYYRICVDNRDLNYDNFFSDGKQKTSELDDYHSHNTERLDVEGMKKMLLKLDFVQEQLAIFKEEKNKKNLNKNEVEDILIQLVTMQKKVEVLEREKINRELEVTR